MTDKQINAAIAQFVNADERWMIEKDYCNGDIPNYCTDLNAMHEAERHLGESSNMLDYTNELYDMACRAMKQNGKWNPYGATARQRAEAFLRTLGKWEEAK
jgi:hypothetical protein